jgi:hypothetical protein
LNAHLLEVISYGSLFFTDCSSKAPGELAKILLCITGVNDSGDACIAGVIKAGKACITGISDTGKVSDFFGVLLARINDTGEA